MIANSAFYSHHPLPQKLKQGPPPTTSSLQAKGFVDSAGRVVPKAYAAWYHGDWDGAAWVYNYFDQCWNDPARGSLPIGWGLDTELSLRFPPAFARKRIFPAFRDSLSAD